MPNLTNLIGDLIENIVMVSTESHSACDTIIHLKGRSLHPVSKLGEVFNPGITVVDIFQLQSDWYRFTDYKI